jgi:hypothetical protein
MPTGLILLLSLHALSSVFWAGSTFTLARNGGVGSDSLFRPQMGAAAIAFLTGAGLWAMLHAGNHGPTEKILSLGVLAALAAAGVQGALRKKPLIAHRIAAGLLALTIVCMIAARYAG